MEWVIEASMHLYIYLPSNMTSFDNHINLWFVNVIFFEIIKMRTDYKTYCNFYK